MRAEAWEYYPPGDSLEELAIGASPSWTGHRSGVLGWVVGKSKRTVQAVQDSPVGIVWDDRGGT